MLTEGFWFLAGIGILILLLEIPFALSDKWKK